MLYIFFQQLINYYYIYILKNFIKKKNYKKKKIFNISLKYLNLKFYNIYLNLFIFKYFYLIFLLNRFFKGKLESREVKYLWSNSYLPTIINLHLTHRLVKYPSIFLIIGNFLNLPINYTYSGIKSPYIILYSKRSFWYTIEKCFFLNFYYFLELNNYNIFYLNLKKINLISTYYIKLGWFISTRYILNNYNQKKNNLLIRNLFKNFLISNNLLFLKKKNNFFFFNIFLVNIFSVNNKFIRTINLYYRQLSILKRNRNIIKNLFFSTFKREKFLIKFFNFFKYKQYLGLQLLNFFELRLINIVLRSQFSFFFYDALWLITNGYIFLNGKVCKKPNFLLKIGDRIQMSINPIIYYKLRIEMSNVISKEYKLNPYVQIELNNYKDILKTKKTIDPKWVKKLIWNLEDIPKYLEVDFLTLTSIVIYKPININDYLPIYIQYIKFLNFKNYNWKYYY